MLPEDPVIRRTRGRSERQAVLRSIQQNSNNICYACTESSNREVENMPILRNIVCSLGIMFLVCAAQSATASAAPVGKVTKVQKQAQVGSRAAGSGTPVHMNDRLRTGPGARMQVTFIDGTQLTLGENASVVVDSYVYNPSKGAGKMALSSTQGAFRFATGKLNQMKDRDVKVNTPHGALAVRGTEFWSGNIDGQYGTYVVKGKVGVRSRGRSATLSRGQGVDYGRRARRR